MREREPIDLDAVRWAIRKGRAVLIPDIDVATAHIHGRTFRFASDRVQDPIQRQNRKGNFYEAEELEMIRAHFPQGGTFVDIGANVGNHSLFVAGFLQPGRIIPFEPNPVAYKLLIANVVMNDFADLFDLRHIGLGLSDGAGEGFAISQPEKNLGSARMKPGEGEIETISGDAALAKETPSFLKIDVEGMEMQVLAGLDETIARAAPTILIEVDRDNYDAFDDWVAKTGYQVVDTFQRYRVNRNYLLKK